MEKKEQMTEQEPKRQFIDDNKVRIGDKPVMVYIGAVLYKMDKYDEIHITAFGMRTNKAIRVGEIAFKKLRLTKIGIFPIEDNINNKKIQGIMVKLKREPHLEKE